MLDDLSVPLHLAVHLAGLMASGGLVLVFWIRRRLLGSTWAAALLGAALVLASHVGGGLVLTEGAAWPVYARAAAYAALAMGAAGSRVPVVAPVGGAIAAFPVHVTAGLTALLAGGATLRGAVARLSPYPALLAAGVVAWGMADVLGNGSPGAEAWTSLVGSLLILLWIAGSGRGTVRGAVIITLSGVVLALTVMLSATSGAVLLEQLTVAQVDDLRDQAASLVTDMVGWPAQLAAAVEPVAGTPTIEQALEDHAAGRTAVRGLDDVARQLAQLTQVDFAILVDRRGRVAGTAFGGIEVPAGWVGRIQGSSAVVAAMEGASSQRDLLVVRDGSFQPAVAAIVATPVAADAGADRSPGILVFGRVADATWSLRTGATLSRQVALVIGDQLVASGTLGSGDVAALTAAAAGGGGEVDLLAGSQLLGVADLGFTDERVVVVVGVATTVLGPTATSTARDVFVRGVLGLLAAIGFGSVAAGALARPIRRLTIAAERVADGDLTTPVALDRDDELGLLGSAFNTMTAAVRAREDALAGALSRESDLRGQVQAITDSMSDGLLATDRRGRITLANPAASQLLGGPASSLVGELIDEVLVGEDDLGQPLVGRLGDPATVDAATVLGRLRFANTAVAVGSAALRDHDGPVVGRVYVMRDRTGEVEVAEMKANIVANISHELRTPMVPVLGYAKRLVTRPDIAPKVAEEMLKGAYRAMRRIEQLIDVSELEGRRMDVAGGSTDIREVLDACIAAIRQAGESGWNQRPVKVTVARDAVAVGMQRKALHRLLLELLDNAMKFSQDPDVVAVAVTRVEDGIQVRVTDKGLGLGDHLADDLGRDFQQGDPSATRRHGGVGAGLSIVRRIAEGLGTELTLAPRRGGGTVATIVLPPASKD